MAGSTRFLLRDVSDACWSIMTSFTDAFFIGSLAMGT